MYQALKNRVIVEPEKVNTTTNSGLIDVSLENSKILKGTVLSIGSKVTELSVGDLVVYGKHSGMILPNGAINMHEDDIFTKVVNE